MIPRFLHKAYTDKLPYVISTSTFYFRGNLEKAIELFDEALLLVRTEGEMAQTYSLKEAAKAQKYVTEKMGIRPNVFMG